MLIKSSGNVDRKAFDPAVLVLMVELGKLVISGLIIAAEVCASQTYKLPELPSRSDVAWFSLPAFLYAMNNILVFHAIAQVDMGSFAVFRETMLIFSAIIWFLVFRIDLGKKRLVAICGIMSSCILNQVVVNDQHAELSLKVFWVLLYALLNA